MKTIELTREEIDKLLNGEEVNIYNEEQCADDDSARIVGLNGYEGVTIKKKVEQWEPKFGEFTLSFNMQPVFVKDHVKSQENLKFLRESGMLMGTYKQAERAAKKMRTFNRLLAYVDEFDPEFEKGYKQDGYYIYYDGSYNLYDVCIDGHSYDVGKVYMSKEVAQELCRKLNSGEVVL